MKGLQLRSRIDKAGELELSLVEMDFADPDPDQVLVKVEATPINPSDLGLLLGPADPATIKASGGGKDVKVTAKVPATSLPFLAARLDQMRTASEGGEIEAAISISLYGDGAVVDAASQRTASGMIRAFAANLDRSSDSALVAGQWE